MNGTISYDFKVHRINFQYSKAIHKTHETPKLNDIPNFNFYTIMLKQNLYNFHPIFLVKVKEHTYSDHNNLTNLVYTEITRNQY